MRHFILSYFISLLGASPFLSVSAMVFLSSSMSFIVFSCHCKFVGALFLLNQWFIIFFFRFSYFVCFLALLEVLLFHCFCCCLCGFLLCSVVAAIVVVVGPMPFFTIVAFTHKVGGVLNFLDFFFNFMNLFIFYLL